MAMTVLGKRFAGPLLLLTLCFATLTVSMQVSAQNISIREDSPQEYVVVKGDTLWDIAGHFLDEPWLWPQVWEINPQIENPDLIYPGDVIELAYVEGAPVLRLSRVSRPELRESRLSPTVRREAILSPVPAIPLDRISSYLSENSVISSMEFEAAPYILAEKGGRSLISQGDEVYARGEWNSGDTAYDVIRKGRTFLDPDTGIELGMEAILVGTATLLSNNGDRAILSINDNEREIRKGDRLIERHSQTIEARYLPVPPSFDVNAAIITIGGGKTVGGLYDTLVLNIGSASGIETGQLLAIEEPPVQLEDTQQNVGFWKKIQQIAGKNTEQMVEFPGTTIGNVLVYRVFEETSLALVLKSSTAVRLEDRVVTP